MNLSNRLTAQILFGLSSIILGFFLLLAVSVRPIADDYCTGAGVTQGFWNYIYNISQTWSGDFSQIAVHALLVGLPLAHLPINFVGFSSLLLSVYLVIAVFDRIWLHLLNAEELKLSKKNKYFAAAAISLLWNISSALPASS